MNTREKKNMQEEQELVTVTVSVPRKRLGDLYRLVAGLNDERAAPGGNDKRPVVGG